MHILVDDSFRTGEILVKVDALDDLWVLYNIIREGDFVKGKTKRRVVIREGTSGERKQMHLKLKTKKCEFHEFTNSLRVLGQIVEGPKEFVSYGDHHTFKIVPGKKFWIQKEKWFKNDINRIKKSIKNTHESSLILCLSIESGIANLALLSNYSLQLVSEIRKNLPGKRYGKQFYQQQVLDFYATIKTIVDENLERNPVKLMVICGPGYFKEDFVEYYKKSMNKNKKATITFKLFTGSSGELSTIHEILRKGEIQSEQEEFLFAQEQELLNLFIENLSKENGKIAYGIEEVQKASEMGAIQDLLVCDILLRMSEIETRKTLEDIMNGTENAQGNVHIFSTKNIAGEQLISYGKIAAILRYKIN